MKDPQESIDPEYEKCTCNEGYVIVGGEKERCPRKCEEGYINLDEVAYSNKQDEIETIQTQEI